VWGDRNIVRRSKMQRWTARRGRVWIRAVTVAGTCATLVAGCGGSKHNSERDPGEASTTTVASTIGTTTTTVAAITYRVRRGDTLTTIAKQFRVPISAIVRFNHITNPDRLAEGQRLRIPPAPPVRLVVRPSVGQRGEAFQLRLTGAQPSEAVTFEIRSPKGTFTGPPHRASTDGAVAATYQTAFADPTGTFDVVATGNEGTTAHTIFIVRAPRDHA
jgi:LysM repeat protein